MSRNRSEQFLVGRVPQRIGLESCPVRDRHHQLPQSHVGIHCGHDAQSIEKFLARSVHGNRSPTVGKLLKSQFGTSSTTSTTTKRPGSSLGPGHQQVSEYW